MSLSAVGHRQRGSVLLAVVAIAGLAAIAVWLNSFSRSRIDAERAGATGAVLTRATSALTAFALTAWEGKPGARPGELPCPDHDEDGVADPPCATARLRLGRLPWRTLGLPDLHDAAGERLWYAVSSRFVTLPRVGALNSNTPGTLTVRAASGAPRHDGRQQQAGSPSPAIAVVLAPGAPLRRADGVLQQRQAAARNDPLQFLDCLGVTPTDCGLEDNAAFTDASLDGFVQAPRRQSSAGDVVFNDRLAVLRYDDLMPLLQRRGLAQVRALFSRVGWPWAASWPAGRTPDGMVAATGLQASASVTEGLLPTQPYHWEWDTTLTPAMVKVSGTVTRADLQGPDPVEPGWCTLDRAPPYAVRCQAERRCWLAAGTRLLAQCAGTADRTPVEGWMIRRLDIAFDASAAPTDAPPRAVHDAPQNGVLQLTDLCGDDPAGRCRSGEVIGTGTTNGASGVRLRLYGYPSKSLPAWFHQNLWATTMYYAVTSAIASPPFPSSATCGDRPAKPLPAPDASCLRVQTTSPAGTRASQVVAVLLAAGPAQNGQSRPSARRDAYFEGENASTGDNVFAQPRLLVPGSDTVVTEAKP